VRLFFHKAKKRLKITLLRPSYKALSGRGLQEIFFDEFEEKSTFSEID
jgi:hypothetical protein